MKMQRLNVIQEATTPGRIEELRSLGYVPIKGSELNEDSDKSLGEMTLKELKAIAKGKGIEGYSVLSKEELLSVLTEDPEVVEDDGSTEDSAEE